MLYAEGYTDALRLDVRVMSNCASTSGYRTQGDSMTGTTTEPKRKRRYKNRRRQIRRSYRNLDAQIFIEKAERARKEREELEEIDRSFDLCVSDFEYSLAKEK